MEYPLLPVFIILNLVLVGTTHAALAPELYWKSVLPSTPMPKTLTDILPHELRLFHIDLVEDKSTNVGVGKGGVSVDVGKGKPRGTSVNVGEGGVDVHTGKGNSGGTDVNVGGKGGGVSVSAGHKGKPVTVTVGPNFPFLYRYAATETQLHDDPKVALFFLEKDLHSGTQLDLHFIKSSDNNNNNNDAVTFLPRQVADTIPFSSEKMEVIFNKLSVEPGSEEALIMKNTIKECEEKSIKDEEKYCATSLESMVDFATSKLGKNVVVVSTVVERETEFQKYTMTLGVKKLDAGDHKGVVVCHKQIYPYAVFYCHQTETTKAYFVPLEGDDGVRVKAVAICHTDTSEWNPKHLAFQLLKIKPGTVPVCHLLPEDHVVWVPK